MDLRFGTPFRPLRNGLLAVFPDRKRRLGGRNVFSRAESPQAALRLRRAAA